MKSLKEMRSQITEVLSKSDPIEKWISDFVHSKDPKFDGKSKEERMKMAKGAYYGAQKEGVMQPNGTDKVGRLKEETVWNKAAKEVKTIKDKMMQRQLNDIVMTLNQIGKAPNSLANIMGNNLIDKLNRQLQRLDTDVRDGVIQKFQKVGLMNEQYQLEEGENKQMKGKDPCWKGYQMVGTKKKNGREVPNCVPEESEIPLSDKEKNKMLSNKDKSTLGKIHSLMQKQKKEGFKSDAQRKAVWASRNEEVNPEAAAKESKKAQMAAKHASEKESLAKKHERERESMKESSAAKLVQTKLGNMDRKNVRIPSPAERRAEMEKRKQMQKEDTDMLSFDEYLEEDMRIAKAASFAKKHAGDMKTAVKKIEGIRKGLTNHPKVKDALKKANEELSDKQKKLDHNKNGKIDGDDLAKVRSGKIVNELNKSTLQSYANKAHQDSMNKAYDAAHTGDRKESDKLHKQAVKRADNVKKADMKASMKTEDINEQVNHAELAKAHDHHGNSHEHEVSNGGHDDHDYIANDHFHAADKHRAAHSAMKKHGADSTHYKKAAAEAKKASETAKDSAEFGPKFRKTAKPNPIKEENLDAEIETLKSYKDFIEELNESDKHEASHWEPFADHVYQNSDSANHEDRKGYKQHMKKHFNVTTKFHDSGNSVEHKGTKKNVEAAKKHIAHVYKNNDHSYSTRSGHETHNVNEEIGLDEMQGGRYVHKGTRYGGAAQVDHDHESDFGIDNEKEKFRRLLQKKPEQKKPAQASTVKKGRGRPMGSKSGARN